jgi:ADP-L-glycero-D-manno-heptose 6-epimerase
MIIVTGDRGFIGSELKQQLELNGYTVHGIDWDTMGKTWTATEPIEWIFHMGAVSSTDAEDWQELINKNIDATQAWIEFAEMHECGITYASSASIYGPWVGSPEYGPVQPQHLYGVSKLTVDNWVLSKKFKVPVQSVRFFNVYGRNEGHKRQCSPVRRYIEQAITQRRLTVWEHEGRLGSRDFISIDDCIDAMMALKDTKETGVFNVGTGQQLTFKDIAQSIQRKMGVENVQVVMAPMPEHMVEKYQWESCADLNKLQATISWTPLTVDEWLDINFNALYNKVQKELNNEQT